MYNTITITVYQSLIQFILPLTISTVCFRVRRCTTIRRIYRKWPNGEISMFLKHVLLYRMSEKFGTKDKVFYFYLQLISLSLSNHRLPQSIHEDDKKKFFPILSVYSLMDLQIYLSVLEMNYIINFYSLSLRLDVIPKITDIDFLGLQHIFTIPVS